MAVEFRRTEGGYRPSRQSTSQWQGRQLRVRGDGVVPPGIRFSTAKLEASGSCSCQRVSLDTWLGPWWDRCRAPLEQARFSGTSSFIPGRSTSKLLVVWLAVCSTWRCFSSGNPGRINATPIISIKRLRGCGRYRYLVAQSKFRMHRG